MAHFFVLLRNIFLNVPIYTSSYFAWTPRIVLMCVSPTSLTEGYFERIHETNETCYTGSHDARIGQRQLRNLARFRINVGDV